MAKQFRIARPSRPPEPFELIYEVREQEKINTGSETEPVWEIRDVEPARWVEETRTFHAKMIVSGGFALDLAPEKGDSQEANSMRQMQNIRSLLRKAIVEVDDFFALLDSDRTVIPAEFLGDLFGWILEESGQRPTSGPQPS